MIGIGLSITIAQRLAAATLKYAAGDALPAGSAFTRASTATYKDIGGVRQTAAINTIRDGHYIGGVRTTLLEASRTNHFLNSGAPVTQTTPVLAVGTYTIWMEGAGSITVSAGTATITGAGVASAGVPVTFNVTVTGTVTYTVAGGPTLAQAELGAFASSYIPTAAAAVTRSADNFVLPFTLAPQAMTVYEKLINLGTAQVAGARYFQFASANPRFIANSLVGGTSVLYSPNGSSDYFGAVAALNDTLEVRAALLGTGSARSAQSINGGAETVAADGIAGALAGAWGTANLALNSGTNGSFAANEGFAAVQRFAIMLGIRSLAEMRAA